jgi:hypothetical protein
MEGYMKVTQEAKLIQSIVKRAQKAGIARGEQCIQIIDLFFAHKQFALRLEELLVAPDFDFIHDFCGIQQHIDRATGEMGDCFVPRYAGRG